MAYFFGPPCIYDVAAVWRRKLTCTLANCCVCNYIIHHSKCTLRELTTLSDSSILTQFFFAQNKPPPSLHLVLYRTRLYARQIAAVERTDPARHDVGVWTSMMTVENKYRADDRQRAHKHYRREVHTCRAVPALVFLTATRSTYLHA